MQLFLMGSSLLDSASISSSSGTGNEGQGTISVVGGNTIFEADDFLVFEVQNTTVDGEIDGNSGFIGLVVPHLIRLIVGSDHRVVIPASALAGGTLLVLADTLARTLLAPRQLPVGALTAAIGVPLFLVLMSRLRAERYR